MRFVESGAGEGNRTLVSTLGRSHSTIEPHPQLSSLLPKLEGVGNSSVEPGQKFFREPTARRPPRRRLGDWVAVAALHGFVAPLDAAPVSRSATDTTLFGSCLRRESIGMDSQAWRRKNDGVLECPRQRAASTPLWSCPKRQSHSLPISISIRSTASREEPRYPQRAHLHPLTEWQWPEPSRVQNGWTIVHWLFMICLATSQSTQRSQCHSAKEIQIQLSETSSGE